MSRRDRKKLDEDATTVTYEADPSSPIIQGCAQALCDSTIAAGRRFDLSPEEQLLSAAMGLAMLVKLHNAEEESVLGIVDKCLRGTLLVRGAGSA